MERTQQYRPHFYTSACGRLELFARDYAGDGPPLLLLHGLTRNSADFEPLAAHLSCRYRLIVPDQRGRGQSQNDPDPANYRPDIYAQDMFALLGGLGIAKAGLIGTSMGGLMAMVMAALSPDTIGPIVLNDVGPELDPAGLARIAGYVGPANPFGDLAEAVWACERINRDAFPDFTETDWLAFARRTTRQREDGKIEFAYDPAIADGFDSDEIAPPDLWPLWTALDVKPVLLLRGAHSDLLSTATAERMRAEHSGPFKWVEVPGRGHAPLLDEPAVLAAIIPFLADHMK